MIPTPHGSRQGAFTTEVLDGITSVVVGDAFFLPSHRPSEGEGRGRGEKMLAESRDETPSGNRRRHGRRVPLACDVRVVWVITNGA